jgi:hypothetical protein
VVAPAAAPNDYEITCGGAHVGFLNNGTAGLPGEPGAPGTQCYMERNEDIGGFDVKCLDGTVLGTVQDGLKGDKGDQGLQGLPGTGGGGGTSCTVIESSNKLYFVIDCGTGGSAAIAKAYCGTTAFNPQEEWCYDFGAAGPQIYTHEFGACVVRELIGGELVVSNIEIYEKVDYFCDNGNLVAVTGKGMCGPVVYDVDEYFCDQDTKVRQRCGDQSVAGTWKPNVTDAEADTDLRGVYNSTTHVCIYGTGANLGYSQLIAISTDVICADGETGPSTTHYCSWATQCDETSTNPNCDQTLGYVRTTGKLRPLYSCPAAGPNQTTVLYNPDKQFCWHPGRATAGVYTRGANNICNGKLAPPSDLGATFDYSDTDNWAKDIIGSTWEDRVANALISDGGACKYLGYDLGPSKSCGDQKREYTFFGQNGCTEGTSTCEEEAGNMVAGLFAIATQFCVLQTGQQTDPLASDHRYSEATVRNRTTYQWCLGPTELEALRLDTLTTLNPGMTNAQKTAKVLEHTAYSQDAYAIGPNEATTTHFCKVNGYAARKEACGTALVRWDVQACDKSGGAGRETVIERCGWDNKFPALDTDADVYPAAVATGGLDKANDPGGYRSDSQFCFEEVVTGTKILKYPVNLCGQMTYNNTQLCARPNHETNIGSGLGQPVRIPNAVCGTAVVPGTSVSTIGWTKTERATWSCTQPSALAVCPGDGTEDAWPTNAPDASQSPGACRQTNGSLGTACGAGLNVVLATAHASYGMCKADLTCAPGSATNPPVGAFVNTASDWGCFGTPACAGGTTEHPQSGLCTTNITCTPGDGTDGNAPKDLAQTSDGTTGWVCRGTICDGAATINAAGDECED